LYLQSVMNNAKTFGPVKAVSAAIAFMPLRARLCIRIPTNGCWCGCIAWSNCPS
jgi:hypothetical protein